MIVTDPDVVRTALVTGASRGIGHAVALRLAGEGYALTVAARDPETLERAGQRLREAGAKEVTTVVGNVGDEAGLAGIAEAHVERHDGLDVLVHAAGVGSAGAFADYPLKRVDLQWNINARSVFALTQLLLPALRTAAARQPERGAKVIALASIEGVATEPNMAAYSMSKAAVISFCESLSVAEHEFGVTATAVSPGFVDTDMAAWVEDRIATKTMIRTDDVAELIAAATRLSRYAVVPNLVITRPGPSLWRA
jgi:3-oxoacyl-[acyl-carrier protein] reductase